MQCKNTIILVGGFQEVIELCELEDIKILGIVDSKKKEDTWVIKYLGQMKLQRICSIPIEIFLFL